MRRFERADERWEIALDGRTVVTRRGWRGAKGALDSERFLFANRARAAYEAYIAERLAAGFVEVLPIATSLAAREPALEAAIRANRSDPAAYEVYADWLQQQGNPLGELGVLQRALEHGDDARKRARVEQILATLQLPDPAFCQLQWRWGFWRSLRLDVRPGRAVPDPLAVARQLFAHPACAVLEELRIGDAWGRPEAPPEVTTSVVLAEAGRAPWAAALRTLALGDVAPEIELPHHCVGIVGPALRAFPRLELLHIQASNIDDGLDVGALELPALFQLTLETCAMSRRLLAQIFRGRLPALTELELWFGPADLGVDITLDDLEPLLAGRVFPQLTSLALCNAELADELARTIHRAPIAAQLEHLELSRGTLEDGGAIVLARHAGRFPKLRALEVQQSFLTPGGIAALRAAFPDVAIDDDGQREGTERHVAVW